MPSDVRVNHAGNGCQGDVVDHQHAKAEFDRIGVQEDSLTALTGLQIQFLTGTTDDLFRSLEARLS